MENPLENWIFRILKHLAPHPTYSYSLVKFCHFSFSAGVLIHLSLSGGCGPSREQVTSWPLELPWKKDVTPCGIMGFAACQHLSVLFN